MNYNKLQKIQDLIEQIEILNTNREVMSIYDLQGIEKKIGCVLPSDYKYFCQELGTGRASGFIDLYCMNDKNINNSDQVTHEMIDRINRNLISRDEHVGCIELLEKALVFASFNDDRIIFWDLRTYNTEDDSYDIYWYDVYAPDSYKPIVIGRNFTDFLCDFCYGQLACSLIPGFCIDNEPMLVEYVFG